ncbi:MAG: hypothetical protein JSU67_07555 [Gammaproteobacteria bacterium]|nr:MAG: hypothetical protein EP300_05485 [Gammaproteobacteria bacterium]UCH41509.1 MAG: hypothetical protein JSU67_07555 [Gammaproteobacteria bacterium]
MSTNKLLDKLEGFFDLSAKKQQKKHHKLLKIIRKLEQKKDALEAELIEAGKEDDTSSRYHELDTELKAISKLIKRAKKHDLHD